MSYCAKLTGEDLSSYLNKIESVGLRYKNAKKNLRWRGHSPNWEDYGISRSIGWWEQDQSPDTFLKQHQLHFVVFYIK